LEFVTTAWQLYHRGPDRDFARTPGAGGVAVLANAQDWTRGFLDEHFVLATEPNGPLRARLSAAHTSEDGTTGYSASSAVFGTNTVGISGGANLRPEHGLALLERDTLVGAVLARADAQRVRSVIARSGARLVRATSTAIGVPEPGTLALLSAAFAVMCGRLLLRDTH
jgi:hypothetical protein